MIVELRPILATRGHAVIAAWQAAYAEFHHRPAPIVTHKGGHWFRVGDAAKPYALRDFENLTLRLQRSIRGRGFGKAAAE